MDGIMDEADQFILNDIDNTPPANIAVNEQSDNLEEYEIPSWTDLKNLYNSKFDAHTTQGSYKSNSNPGYIFVQWTSISKQVMVSSCVKLPCTDVKNQLVDLIMVE